jgi:hypothetical protein
MRETGKISVVAPASRLYILFNKFASVGTSTIPSWPLTNDPEWLREQAL